MHLKSSVSLATVTFSLLLCSFSAFAQWDYRQDAIDNIIESRIDRRKTQARIRARKRARTNRRKSSKSKSAKRTATKPVSKKLVSKKATATLPHHAIAIHRDTYQDFHMDDINGYVVTFRFTPTGTNRKPIAKTYLYSHLKNRQAAEYNDLPIGIYTVQAGAVYRGKNYAVHLGTQEGTSTEPTGGNFAPTLKLQVKTAKDAYDDLVVQGFPSIFYIRVIE